MKYLIFMCCMVFSGNLLSQKYDYVWPYGYDGDLTNQFGISALNFNDNKVVTYPYIAIEKFKMGNFSSFICNKEGELVLITNNCEVVDADFNIIEGGNEVTPGPQYSSHCEPFGTYTGTQVTVFLPEVNTDSVYYLVHMDSEISNALQAVLSKNLYVSTIVEKPSGAFYLKQKDLILSENLVKGRIAVCRHKDGERWWVMVIGFDTNIFYKFLIGNNSFEGPYTQEIGIPQIFAELDNGQLSFAPNGKLLGINNEGHGLLLYDFNPETGELSNFRKRAYPKMNEGDGIAFSPNSRFAYLTTGEDLFQIDLEDPDSATAITYIANHWTVDEAGWPIGMGSMYLGPDCRIYVSPGTTTFYMHVIHRPNVKGWACQFEPKAIKTPTRLHHNLPNIPIYRAEENVCDPDIEWVITSTTEAKKEEEILEVYPNPAKTETVIQLPVSHSYQSLVITDIMGRKIGEISISKGAENITLNTSEFDSGIYFIIPENTTQKAVKLIVSQ